MSPGSLCSVNTNSSGSPLSKLFSTESVKSFRHRRSYSQLCESEQIPRCERFPRWEQKHPTVASVDTFVPGSRRPAFGNHARLPNSLLVNRGSIRFDYSANTLYRVFLVLSRDNWVVVEEPRQIVPISCRERTLRGFVTRIDWTATFES
jgi:hypothetical protein